MTEIEPDTKRHRIGELAALSGVTRRALRLYEARGLLGEPERTESGYRLYGVTELVRAIRIRRLRTLGLSQCWPQVRRAGDRPSPRGAVRGQRSSG